MEAALAMASAEARKFCHQRAALETLCCGSAVAGGRPRSHPGYRGAKFKKLRTAGDPVHGQMGKDALSKACEKVGCFVLLFFSLGGTVAQRRSKDMHERHFCEPLSAF